MGLHVNIYKEARQEDSWLGSIDCTMGGESSYAKGFTVVNADGPFDPCEDYPAAELVMAEPIGGKRILRLIPESKKGKWTMFGGNYAGTSDSRFSELCEKLLGVNFYGAVAVHDRVEGQGMAGLKQTLSFLEAYKGDLEYGISNGIDSINHSTNGTPFFYGEGEATEYLSELQTLIIQIKRQISEKST